MSKVNKNNVEKKVFFLLPGKLKHNSEITEIQNINGPDHVLCHYYRDPKNIFSNAFPFLYHLNFAFFYDIRK